MMVDLLWCHVKIVFEVSISFMEIYNENAYDLLDKKHIELPLE